MLKVDLDGAMDDILDKSSISVELSQRLCPLVGDRTTLWYFISIAPSWGGGVLIWML
jgi:hypothetical protein